MIIPTRCTSCVNWLGHDSGKSNDIRCNRNWSYSELALPEQDKDLVETDCKVLKDDSSTVALSDDNGDTLGLKGKAVYVDAYVPLLKATNNEWGAPGDTIRFVASGTTEPVWFTSTDLKNYLQAMTPTAKAKLLAQAKDRNKTRSAMQKQHAKHYEKKHTIAPSVMEGSANLPPYAKGLEKVPTGLAPLDIALKGGIPVGTRLNISGSPDAGKSTLVNRIEGAFIKYYTSKVREFWEQQGSDPEEVEAIVANEKIGLIKPESFEYNYMKSAMALDEVEGKTPQELFDAHCDIIATNFAEESTQYVVSALNADNASNGEFRSGETYSYMLPNTYRLFTLDSIDAEDLAEEAISSKGESMIGDNHRIAGSARLLAEFFRKAYKAAKIPVTLLLVSQHRTANIQIRAKTSIHRGKAHPYFTNLEFNLYSPKMDDKAITKEVVLTFGKTHVDASVKQGDSISLYLRPGVGFTMIDNCVPVAFDLGILDKAGSWVSYTALNGDFHRSQGSDPGKVANWLTSLGLERELYERTMEAATTKPEAVITPSEEELPSQEDFTDIDEEVVA